MAFALFQSGYIYLVSVTVCSFPNSNFHFMLFLSWPLIMCVIMKYFRGGFFFKMIVMSWLVVLVSVIPTLQTLEYVLLCLENLVMLKALILQFLEIIF